MVITTLNFIFLNTGTSCGRTITLPFLTFLLQWLLCLVIDFLGEFGLDGNGSSLHNRTRSGNGNRRNHHNRRRRSSGNWSRLFGQMDRRMRGGITTNSNIAPLWMRRSRPFVNNYEMSY
jgi:hypothetical protein